MRICHNQLIILFGHRSVQRKQNKCREIRWTRRNVGKT